MKTIRIISIITLLSLNILSAFAVTYYSRANTAWNVATTWSTVGYGGTAATAFPTVGDIVNIGNGNSVSVSANATCASITIDADGALTTTGTSTVSATTRITINGTYTNQSTGGITTPTWLCNGIYNHATSSALLPLGTTSTTWDANSNLNITGSYTAATVFLNFANQTFGNFTFNPSTMTNTVSLVGAAGTTTILGNFTITQTGTSTLFMRIYGQQFANTLNIYGNFTQSAGTFDLHNGGPTPTLQSINLKGNFTLSGTSVLTQSTTQTGSTVGINFTGTGVQTVSISPTASITSQATTSTCAIQFNVASGSTIDMGTSVLIGTNNTSFILSPNATLRTANTGGISASGASGSIQVSGTRNYSTSANYIYNGATAQVTGSGLPSTLNNLTIDNNSGVTFSSLVTITGTLALESSAIADLNSLAINTNGLTIGGVSQSNGTYGGTGSGAATILSNFASNSGILNVSCISDSWTGTTSTDWNDVSNWSCGIPSSTTSVIINAGGNQPIIETSASCANITINTGATLSISANNTLTVGGNWMNSGTFTPNSGTVIFNNAAQTISGLTTFNNVTIGGSAVKTITTRNFTVTGILSMEGTAILSAIPTYGAAATLQYNTSTARTSGVEWISPFTSSGGVIIDNTGEISLNSAKIFNAGIPLTINASAILTPGANLLTIGGDFINNGALTSGTFGVTINGTAASQNIGSIATTGAISMTKTAGTVTFTGNMSGGAFTLNGIGGILNLGSGLTHTFTGTFTRTNGTLDLNSSTLNINGATSGTGGTWIQGTSTVLYGGAAQTIFAGNYYNLTLSGTGTKTFVATTTGNNISINTGVIANLGIGLTHSTSELYLGGVVQTPGTWGGSSTATNINTTYFTTASGVISIANIWTGATDTDWDTASNWSEGIVPTTAWDVIIPAVTNQPIIGTTAYCNNITINTSASLTISGSNILNVNAKWSNSGTFTANSSTVLFNGAAQTITGATTFNNVTIGGSAVKTITTANFIVNGILSMEGTATISAAPTYGSAATLQYNTSSAKTAGAEWITSFSASGGIIIGNTGVITMNSVETLNSTAALTINSGATLAMSTFLLTLNGDLINNGGITSGSGGVTIAGTATQSIGSFSNSGTVTMTKTGGTATFTGNINAGTLRINGTGGTLDLGVGLTHTCGNVTLTRGTLNGGSSILNNNSSTTSAWTGTGSNFIAGTSTVAFGGVNQTLATATTFYNLTFKNSGIKTLTGTPTITNVLSMEGTATISKVPIYGSSATLQYNTSTARTLSATSYEWISTFVATGGIIIASTGKITLNTAKVFNAGVPLTINSGASLATANNQLTFGGDFTNNGTFTAGNSPIVISGTANAQNIAGLTTTGTVSLTKTSGTATLIGNVNAGALTINGNGGTLHLGTDLTHTFTGNITLSAGTLNGGSSALQVNSSTASAWTGTGSYFNAGTGTVSFGGVNQTINTATTFNNLTLSGSGTKTFAAATITLGNFTLRTGVLVNLGTFTHSAEYLYEEGSDKASGSYGSTASTATYKEANYFGTSATGLLNINSSTGCSGGNNTWTGAIDSDWNTAGNWCIGVPTSSTNIIIPSGGNQPIISGAAICAGININSGATLTINGTNSLEVKGDWQNNGTFIANSSTVNFSSLASQSILGTSTTAFSNLTISNGGAVTLTTVPVVEGILSIEGAALATTPTYGANATLQYNSTTLQTAGAEWISPFIASGGIIIKNSGIVTLNAAKVLGNNTNVPLNINSGATLATADYGLTLHGDFINAGTLSAGSSPITFDGTTATQNIAGLTTTGTVTCNKSAGTATLTGALNAGGLINSTPGGTLHLGTSLTHTITGAWTRTNGILNGGSSILIIGGNVTNSGGTFTAGTGTVNYNGTTAPQVTANVNYYNLALSGTGTKTLQSGTTTISGNLSLLGTASATTVGNLSVSGNLSIGTGSTLTTASTNTLGVTGTTSISGTYIDGSTGAKTFTGNITLNTGAVWNETAISTYSIAGNLTNNATTFIASTGAHTFTGASKIVSGNTAITIPSTTFSGTYSNNGTLTVSTTLAGAGTLTQGVGSILNIGGASSISNLLAGSNSNTVNYTGASQTILPITYYHLTLSGSGTETLTNISTINGNLTTTGTVAINAATALTIGGNVSIGATSTFVAGAFTHNVGGNWTKNGSFNSTGSTINFNGTSAQIITANVANFNNIVFSGTGNITASGTLGINGDVTINSGSTFIAGNYTHSLKGNWINNGSFTANTSTISLINTTTQQIAGSSPTAFNNLGLNGTGGATLGIASSVDGTLTLNLGKIDIGDYNLTIAPTGTITGGSATSFIKTSTTGRLKQQIEGLATKNYPIGKSAYNPISVTNNGSNSTDNYSIRVGQDTIENANSSKTINRQWYIMKDIAGSTNLTVAATYNSGEEGIGFNNTTNPEIAYFSGSTWAYSPIISGSGTRTFTASGSAPDMSNANGFLTLGSGDAFNASKLSVTVLPPTPYRGQTSSIATIQSLNSNDVPTYVNTLTTFDLTSNVSFQRVGGLTSFTLAANTYQTIVNNIQFDVSTWNETNLEYDLSATVTATPTSGEMLTAATTPAFAIKEGSIYQPLTSGNWSTVQWQISTDGGTSWSNTALPADNIFTETDLIQIPVGINLTADVITSFYSMLVFGTMNINSSGTLTINHTAFDASDYNLTVYGTLESSGGSLINTNLSYTAVRFLGGTYLHNMNGGSIPTASWTTLNGTASTCNITGITTTPLTGLNQSFQNFTWNNAGQTVLQYLNGNLNVSGILDLVNGVLSTDVNHVIEAANGSITRTNGYINGNLRIYVPNASAPTIFFPIGDTNYYAPISISFAGTVSGSGYFDASTTAGQPPFASGLSQTNYINRKWTINNSGVGGFTSFTPTFTFDTNDEVGSPTLSNLVIRKLNGTTWTSLPTTQSGNSLSAPELVSFSDFYAGESDCNSNNSIWLGSTSTDWNTASNWCSGSVPTSTTNVTIPATTNQPIISASSSCANLDIQTGASLTIAGSNLLNVTSNWTNSGTFTANNSTVSFTGATAQTITGASAFFNVTINNAAGITSANNLTVNGLLTLTTPNPDATHGTLDMGSNTLSMLSASAAIRGTGDVSGIVKRTHTFTPNTEYQFGSQYTTLNFLGAGTQPNEITCTISLGSGLPDKTETVLRHYSFAQTGTAGTDKVTMNLRYLTSELNGNTESNMVLWDNHFSGNVDEHGKTDNNTVNHWVGLSGFAISYIASTSAKNWGFANYTAIKNTWVGGADTDWNNDANWTAGHAPYSTDDILIPDVSTASTNFPSLTSDVEIRTLEIDSNAILTANSFTLTINGYTGAWSNNGTFIPGTGTVSLTHGIATDVVTISGNGINQFNDINIAANTFIRPETGVSMKISGMVNGDLSSIVDLSSLENTVEYNGTDQYIVNPLTAGFGFTGYYNLTISGSGTKTLVDNLTLSGNLINNGTLSTGTGTVSFIGTTAQTISGSSSIICSNLTINNASGVSSSTDLTVNGALTFVSDNPSTNDKGALNMTNNSVLHMGEISTTTGPGEVSGIINRSHTFNTSTFYSFGNQKNGVTFAAVATYPGQTLPTSISLNINIGTTPDWSTHSGATMINPIKRYYDIYQTGGSGTRALMQVHYRDNEIPSGISESLLTIWSTTNVNGTFYNKESGRSGYDLTDNFVTIQDVDFAKISSSPGDFKGTLAPSTTTNYTWNGTVSTNWSNSANWTPNGVPDATHGAIIPDASTTPNNPTLSSTASCVSLQINAGGILNAPTTGGNFTITGANAAWSIESGAVFNAKTSTVIFNANAVTAGDVSIVGNTNFYNLTISSGTLVRPAANSNTGIGGTLTNSGTLAAATNECTFEFNGQNTQTIPNPNGSTPGYHNLILSNDGAKMLPSVLNIVDEFTNNTTGTGTVVAGNGTVYLNGNSIYGQSINGSSTQTSFNNLTVDNPSNTVNVTTQISVNKVLNITAGSILDMGANALSGASSTTTTGTGTIYTQNTADYTPLPSGKTWTISVVYNGASAQKLVGGIYNNLTISNTFGVTAVGDLTVNGILDLNGNNPSATQGVIETASYTLNMGALSTTSGNGDITGVVQRQHTFITGQDYSFGNPYTNLTFTGTSESVKPAWVSCKIAIGTAPSWKTGAIKRTYSFAQDGTGTDNVSINLHYLASELNSNNESKIVLWDYHTDGTIDQHGKTNNDATNKWIGLSGLRISYIAPTTTLTDKQWGLSNSTIVKNTWLSADGTTQWDVAQNWSAGHYPGQSTYTTDSVLIPAGVAHYPILTLPVEMSTLEIESGASLTADSYDVTINGSTGAWYNNGTFTSTTGNLIFSAGNLSKVVTIEGINNNLHNLQVLPNTYIQMSSGSYLKIGGSILTDATSLLDFTSNKNTVEFNGENQTIENITGASSSLGYHDLVISGSGTKTLSSTLNIAGDFINNGTIDALTNSSTVVIKDQGHVQSIGGSTTTTFYNLTIDNTNQLVNATSNVNVSNTLAVNASSTLDMGNHMLGGNFNSTSGTGIFKTQCTSTTPFPSAKTWTFGVVLNNRTTTQTVPSGTYNSLQISNPTSVSAAGDLNSSTLIIDNGSTLNMNIHTLTSVNTISGLGTLKTQNTSSVPIPSGKTWPGSVVYNGSTTQTAVAGTFGNINIDNTAGVSMASNANATVNGTLLINSGRNFEIGSGTEVIANFITNNAGTSGLTIKSNSTVANGTLIFNNTVDYPVLATVEMYSKASWNLTNPTGSKYKWQYFGVPIKNIAAFPSFNGAIVRRWDEPTSKWVQLVNSSELPSFAGYEITQANAKTYSFAGQLENGMFSAQFSSFVSGQYLFSNPYTAAININELNFGGDMDATVYLYNTGSYNDWYTTGQGGSYGTNPGQYISVPIENAGLGELPSQIPSMQGFLVGTTATPTTASITIPYSSVVKNTTLQRSKQLKSTSNASPIYSAIEIAGARYTDKMWLFTNPNCSHGFDNGWDGSKIMGSTLAPQIWAAEPSGNYQVNTVEDANNTTIAFKPGEDTKYTMTITNSNIDGTYPCLYLLDMVTNASIDITQSGTKYTFTTSTADPVNRFKISGSPSITTKTDEVLDYQSIYNVNQTIFVDNKSEIGGELTLIDMSGRIIQKHLFSANCITTIRTDLCPGCYVAKLSTSKGITVKQLIMR